MSSKTQLKACVSVIGAPQVGKKTLVEGHMRKYFKGELVEGDLGKHTFHIYTNKGLIELTMFIVQNVKDVPKERMKECDGHIIMSDVTDENMHTLFKKRYIDLIDCLGTNTRKTIVNFFNKTDVTYVPTYIFDSSVPSFDISAKTTSGINDALTSVLRRVFNEQNLLICM
jgi:hypothetical protein